MVVELFNHQKEAIPKIHNGSVLKGGVGTGKSITAMAYYYQEVLGGQLADKYAKKKWLPPTKAVDIVIITTAKKRDSLDWQAEGAAFGITTSREASINGVKMTVDSWNNILNYQDTKGKFFIFDEQRLVGSGAWVKAFIKIAAHNKWIMLSATPGDTWMDYIPIFLAHGWYPNRTAFIREHVVFSRYSKFPKVERYVGTAKLQKLRQRVLVEMPYDRHTKRNFENITVTYDHALYDRVTKDRWHIYEDRPIKDVGEMFILMRKVVNSDPARLGAVMALLEKHDRLIVFYNFNYELDSLRTLGSTLGIPMAEWNGHKHQEIPDTKKWIYLVQYTAGSEGWNCIETNAIAYYSLNYSWKLNEQSRGRIDRLNTLFTNLYYYIIRSDASIDTAIWKSIVSKKNFDERAFAKTQMGLAA